MTNKFAFIVMFLLFFLTLGYACGNVLRLLVWR